MKSIRIKAPPIALEGISIGTRNTIAVENKENIEIGDILNVSEYDYDSGEYTGKNIRCVVTSLKERLYHYDIVNIAFIGDVILSQKIVPISSLTNNHSTVHMEV